MYTAPVCWNLQNADVRNKKKMWINEETLADRKSQESKDDISSKIWYLYHNSRKISSLEI